MRIAGYVCDSWAPCHHCVVEFSQLAARVVINDLHDDVATAHRRLVTLSTWTSLRVVEMLCSFQSASWKKHKSSHIVSTRTCYVCLSSVCNVRVPYSDGWSFGQYSFIIWYLIHPLTSVQNFTEIVPGEPSVGGVKHKRKMERWYIYISKAVAYLINITRSSGTIND